MDKVQSKEEDKEPTTKVENIEEGIPSIDKVEGTKAENKEEPQRHQGRPPKDIESIRRIPFSVSLSPKLVEKIADQADEEGVSRSELVNEAVAFYLDMHKPGQEYIFVEREEFGRILREVIDEEYGSHRTGATKNKSEAEKVPPKEQSSKNQGPEEEAWLPHLFGL
jgi:Arc/MetJ-type ribon-helix-helix transcriptional regulator